MSYKEAFDGVRTVLVIDWPSKEVPEALALAGFQVVVRGGPGPQDYSAYQVDQAGTVVRRPTHQPDQAELIYSHRPMTELPSIVSIGKALHAKVIWTQSGISAPGTKDPRGCWVLEADDQRDAELVRSAGMSYFSQPYIADAVREVVGSNP
jgi:hypothetical protein